ncbi:aklanonic acid methyltransferase DauC [Ferrovum sp. JA12]|uniref:methyltransferase domain-containing protein n=1 Tax=Ferrovum sp. JA12 TaxID=1356299 RepID=UPI000702AF9A|nr:methyltransferase domain-containing protein [Ferrovum sp. JA12]KRH78786.1 aklanonic acid methyltransferase DauC [Ferrovum sp. JA12]
MHDIVKDYYGKELQSSLDLKTTACCDPSAVPDYLKPLLANIHPEVLSRYYGCGLVAPEKLKGCRVLDLGCGTGRDVYLLSQLVGPEGEVIGIDMTEEQLHLAESYMDYHAEKFGYRNVSFVRGLIERLDEIGLALNSFDVIISNCVINLTLDKQAVLSGIMKLLKNGGEFYFSDVYADRRVPHILQHDPVLYGECLGGALYWNDFRRVAQKAGFMDPRLVSDHSITVTDPVLKRKIGPIRFFSATYRLFNINELEDACENHGQAVIFKGSIDTSPDIFVLDKHHSIERNKIFPVCGNTYRMLRDSRFSEDFEFLGTFDNHFGIFEGCGSDLPFNDASVKENSCC